MFKKGALFLAFLVIILIIFLSYRASAQSQTDVSRIANYLAVSERNLALMGFEVSAEPEGTVSETGTELLFEASQVVVIPNDQGYVVASLEALSKGSDDPEKFLSVLYDELQTRLEEFPPESTWIVKYDFGEAASYVAIDQETLRIAGFLSDVSRVALESMQQDTTIDRDYDRKIRATSQCHRRTLTRNIFGDVAEWAEICVRTQCTNGFARNCRIHDKRKGEWYFGYVNFSPPERQGPGKLNFSTCYAEAKISWGIRLLDVELFNVGIGTGGFGYSQDGTVNASTDCYK